MEDLGLHWIKEWKSCAIDFFEKRIFQGTYGKWLQVKQVSIHTLGVWPDEMLERHWRYSLGPKPAV